MRPVLRGLAWLFLGAIRVRNRYHDRRGPAYRAGVPVISVGNLTVGGTGKTPIVRWLVQRLIDAGRRPAIVSRGYGGNAGRGPVVVSSGRGPEVEVAVSGDEPWMLARWLDQVPVVVGSDRPSGARAAVDLGADCIVLDDGFQHRRLARDLDLVLLDATNPFGNGRLLPAGVLREPLTGLGRADLVLITRIRSLESSPSIESIESIESVVRRYNREAPILRAGHRTMGLFDHRGLPAARPARIVAFCGIGNPDLFRDDLERDGMEVVAFRSHRDHHRFTRADIAELDALASRHEATLVTTEKDQVRSASVLDGIRPPGLLTLRIEAHVQDPGVLIRAVGRTLERSVTP